MLKGALQVACNCSDKVFDEKDTLLCESRRMSKSTGPMLFHEFLACSPPRDMVVKGRNKERRQ